MGCCVEFAFFSFAIVIELCPVLDLLSSVTLIGIDTSEIKPVQPSFHTQGKKGFSESYIRTVFRRRLGHGFYSAVLVNADSGGQLR